MIRVEATTRNNKFVLIKNKAIGIINNPIDNGTRNIGPRKETELFIKIKNKTENKAVFSSKNFLTKINNDKEIKIVMKEARN
mgnify:CR=1 FL=1